METTACAITSGVKTPSPPCQLTNEQTRILQATIDKVHERMSQYSLSHDFAHVVRVLDNAKNLLHRERRFEDSPFSKADIFLCLMSALVHDYADKKLLGPGETVDDQVLELRDFLRSEGLDDEDVLRKLESVVRGLGYSKRGTETKPPHPARPKGFEEFPEFFIVEDADALDAIGPVGQLRCAAVCGERKLPLTTPQTPRMSEFLINGGPVSPLGDRSYIDHNQHKLLFLAEKMHTESATIRAQELHQLDKTFLFKLEEQVRGVWNSRPVVSKSEIVLAAPNPVF